MKRLRNTRNVDRVDLHFVDTCFLMSSAEGGRSFWPDHLNKYPAVCDAGFFCSVSTFEIREERKSVWADFKEDSWGEQSLKTTNITPAVNFTRSDRWRAELVLQCYLTGQCTWRRRHWASACSWYWSRDTAPGSSEPRLRTAGWGTDSRPRCTTTGLLENRGRETEVSSRLLLRSLGLEVWMWSSGTGQIHETRAPADAPVLLMLTMLLMLAAHHMQRLAGEMFCFWSIITNTETQDSAEECDVMLCCFGWQMVLYTPLPMSLSPAVNQSGGGFKMLHCLRYEASIATRFIQKRELNTYWSTILKYLHWSILHFLQTLYIHFNSSWF